MKGGEEEQKERKDKRQDTRREGGERNNNYHEVTVYSFKSFVRCFKRILFEWPTFPIFLLLSSLDVAAEPDLDPDLFRGKRKNVSYFLWLLYVPCLSFLYSSSFSFSFLSCRLFSLLLMNNSCDSFSSPVTVIKGRDDNAYHQYCVKYDNNCFSRNTRIASKKKKLMMSFASQEVSELQDSRPEVECIGEGRQKRETRNEEYQTRKNVPEAEREREKREDKRRRDKKTWKIWGRKRKKISLEWVNRAEREVNVTEIQNFQQN